MDYLDGTALGILSIMAIVFIVLIACEARPPK